MKRYKIWKISRAFNSGQWEYARSLSKKLIDHGTCIEFASDIILRSYWNEKRYRDVINFAKKYPSADTANLSKKATDRLEGKIAAIPFDSSSDDLLPNWDPSQLSKMWTQENQVIWFRTPYGCVKFIMPEDYELKSTSAALLELASELLLWTWHPNLRDCGSSKREMGSKYALSFSCGIDSTAAMSLMPDDTILAYHRRDFKSMLDHSNAEVLIEQIKKKTSRDVIVIPSDHEKIRTHEGLNAGFSTDYAAGVHLILMADHLDLKGIAFGTPIDNTWLSRGRKYRNFEDSAHWKRWKSRFQKAGLELVLPINMISEAGALKICKNGPLIDHINSCLRSENGKWCGKCWKCFHKNGPLGRDFDPNAHEIRTYLNKRPLRTAMHALWAIKNMQLEELVPDLNHLLNDNLDWWEEYYSPGINLLPLDLKQHINQRLDEELKVMSLPIVLETIDLFPND